MTVMGRCRRPVRQHVEHPETSFRCPNLSCIDFTKGSKSCEFSKFLRERMLSISANWN